MSILIKKPGILSTVQDLGRVGFRGLGINPNGVMDRTAARLINILLGNDENTSVIEMHFPAAEIMFESDCRLAVGGANFGMCLDDEAISNWRVHRASKGSVLKFPIKLQGERIYLAICGGFGIEECLGSSSTNLFANFGGYCGRKLEAGDRLESCSDQNQPTTKLQISSSLIPQYRHFPTIRVVRGGEFDLLDQKSQGHFETSDFQISTSSNRMGFRLNAEPLTLFQQTELLSSAVNFGTIQLLPDGQLIVLMADHQTTGGYPRIANVIENDLPLLAQIGANDKVAFSVIDIAEAEQINGSFQRDINLFKTGVRLCS